MVLRENPNQPALGRTHHMHVMHGTAARQPLAWLGGAGLALFAMGVLIVVVAGSLELEWAGSPSWEGAAIVAGTVLLGLSFSLLGICPGVLLLLRHPWAGVCLRLYQRLTGQSLAQPRLLGLTLIWAGVLLTGMAGAIVFLSTPALEAARTESVLLALDLAAAVPPTVVILVNPGRHPTI